jgi:CBS domain-containing protein
MPDDTPRATLEVSHPRPREERNMATPIQPYQGSYLMPAFDEATVADVMRPGVMSCEPDVPAVSVARLMATHHIHAVVVDGVRIDSITGEHLVWGLVSDLDLARAAHAGVEGLTAADLAASEPLAIELTAPLAEAAQIMDEHATAHLVVVEAGRPIGVISTLDIAGALAWGRA